MGAPGGMPAMGMPAMGMPGMPPGMQPMAPPGGMPAMVPQGGYAPAMMPPQGQYAMGGGAIPTQLPEGIRLIPPGQGKKREADDDGPEKRLDSSDGNFYD